MYRIGTQKGKEDVKPISPRRFMTLITHKLFSWGKYFLLMDLFQQASLVSMNGIS